MLPSSKSKVFFYLHGYHSFNETKSFYKRPQFQGESCFEARSSKCLETSFVPFLQEPSHTTFGTLDTSPGTSRMDISEVAPNKGVFVSDLRSTSEISHVSKVAPNKGIFVPESRAVPKINHPENIFCIQCKRRQKHPNPIQEHHQSSNLGVSAPSSNTLEPLKNSLNFNC